MADDGDSKPKRAPYVMGDDERVRSGRARKRLARLNAPKHIEPEATPPPRIDYDTIPPALQDAFKSIEGGLERLWDAREDNPRLSKLETKIEAYTQGAARSEALINDFLLPQTKRLMAGVENTNLAIAELTGNVGRMADSLERIGRDLKHEIKSLDERLELVEDRSQKHEVALVQIDEHRLPHRLSTVEQRLAHQDAGDQRELALVKRRNRFIAAVWAAISAVGGAVAGWLTSK